MCVWGHVGATLVPRGDVVCPLIAEITPDVNTGAYRTLCSEARYVGCYVSCNVPSCEGEYQVNTHEKPALRLAAFVALLTI